MTSRALDHNDLHLSIHGIGNQCTEVKVPCVSVMWFERWPLTEKVPVRGYRESNGNC